MLFNPWVLQDRKRDDGSKGLGVLVKVYNVQSIGKSKLDNLLMSLLRVLVRYTYEIPVHEKPGVSHQIKPTFDEYSSAFLHRMVKEYKK
jgi:hypothetical protein